MMFFCLYSCLHEPSVTLSITQKGRSYLFVFPQNKANNSGSTILRTSYLALCFSQPRSVLSYKWEFPVFSNSSKHILCCQVLFNTVVQLRSQLDQSFFMLGSQISSYSCWHKHGVETPGGGETFPLSSNKLLLKSNLSSTFVFSSMFKEYL